MWDRREADLRPAEHPVVDTGIQGLVDSARLGGNEARLGMRRMTHRHTNAQPGSTSPDPVAPSEVIRAHRRAG